MSQVEYREEPCRSALNRVTGMAFEWSLNPYMGCSHRCAFCYVRGFERRADRPSDDRYGRSIRVKTNIAAVLRQELTRPSWKREEVAFGAATDPYQPAEGKYRLTRACLEALAAARNPFGLITRGTLIVRDIDVLVEASQRADVSINFSIPTLDERIWSITEPGTPPPGLRLRAIERLVGAGVKAGVGVAPILPGLSDDPAKIADVVRAARDAGATFVWGGMLYLRPGTKEHFLETIGREWPELAKRYEQLYAHRAYLQRAEMGPVEEVQRLRREMGIADRRRVRLRPPEPPSQMALGL
jgi:DNA repair photolyase